MMQGVTWEAVGIAMTVLIALFTLLVGVIKWLLDRYADAIKSQIELMSKQIAAQAGEVTRLDKEILKLRNEMVRDFISRDDHIRYETVINAKVDAIGTKIEHLSFLLGDKHAAHTN